MRKAIILSILLMMPTLAHAGYVELFSNDSKDLYLHRNVGIGTSAPQSALVVKGTATVDYIVGDGSGITNLPASGSLPSGIIVFMISGSCPTGWSEVTELNGKTILGTLAANVDVGTTGGSDTITPAGTVSQPTFTGNALASHQHDAISAGTPAGTISAISATATGAVKIGTSTSSAAANSHTHPAPTFTGTPLGTHQHAAISAGTPSGTVSQPTFTGTQFDNRSAYIKLIGCKKD